MNSTLMVVVTPRGRRVVGEPGGSREGGSGRGGGEAPREMIEIDRELQGELHLRSESDKHQFMDQRPLDVHAHHVS